MVTPRALLGEFVGVPRLRVAKPGFDVTDQGLGNEQLAFDSAWPEILSVLAADWQLTGSPSIETFSAYSTTWTRLYRTVTFAALPWEPICIGWMRQVISDQVQYIQTPSCSYTDRCTFTVPTGADDTAYIIFANPLTAIDSREADNGGSYSLLAGVHPTRGPGLFVPRRGADVLTCPDRDLRLTIENPPFQIAEAGAVWGSPSGGSIDVTIALQGSYPDFPPVIVLAGENKAGAPAMGTGPSVTWIDDSTITVSITTGTAQAVQYIVPGYDPAYVHGADAASTPRVLMDATVGLAVSRKDVDVQVATEDELLFRATRSALHVAERHAVNSPGTALIGSAALATKAVGPPIGVFGAYHLGRWWSTIGGIVTQQYAFSAPASGVPTVNGELFAWVNSDKRLRYNFAASHTTPNLRAAVIDHSATLVDDTDLYSGPALDTESSYTDFSADTVGAAPAGWTIRYRNVGTQVLRVDAVSGSLSGNALRAYAPSVVSNGEMQSSFDAPGRTVADFDMLVGALLTGGPDTYPFEVLFRHTGNITFQVAGLRADVVSGAQDDPRTCFGTSYFDPVSGSLVQEFYGRADFAWAYDTWYWYRLNVRGDQRRIKVWPRGQAEPIFWTLSFVGPGVASGRVGLHLAGTPTAKAYCDFFSICTTGRPAWGPLT